MAGPETIQQLAMLKEVSFRVGPYKFSS